jgi:dipeptidyl aminopeptidase/acylaminoacyl peptidase
VGLDGKGIATCDPGDADHGTSLSPSKKFMVDVFSRTDMAPKAILMDETGKPVMDLESMDVTKLLEMGWKLPEVFTVKAADGVTDITGNMWKPADFDPKRKYPIIAHVYPGPQTESVTATFSASGNNQRLANLGFIVIQIGNRGGNPARSNAYHSYGYFNLRDYALADKKFGIEQLAAKHPWVDVDRVGIYGHSGGGFLTAAALLLPPYNEFFKVGVSSAGNHDNNVYNQNWSEQHHGLKEVPVKDKDGKDTGEKKFEIKVPANHELAANLKGKLLLVHGDMDNNVHHAGTMRLVNGLIKANKRFDFMLLPGKAHGFGDMQQYFQQMLMEYFAEHLLGDNYRDSADMKVGG